MNLLAAIDATKDPVTAAKRVCDIPGVKRILTSGGRKSALEGANVIKAMMAEVRNDVPEKNKN